MAVGVGDGLEVEDLLGLGLHSDGQGLRHEDFAAQYRQEVLLSVAKLSRVGRETEGQEAEVVLSSHFPAHFLAATRQNGFHRYQSVGNQKVHRLHRANIKDLEFRLRGDSLVARVDDIGHKP